MLTRAINVLYIDDEPHNLTLLKPHFAETIIFILLNLLKKEDKFLINIIYK